MTYKMFITNCVLLFFSILEIRVTLLGVGLKSPVYIFIKYILYYMY